jgi:hypothetical protein
MSTVAWERFSIQTLNEKTVRVYWETNDDRDWGMPTEYASDTHTFTGEDALEKAKRHCGVSRQGIGHQVTVTLDGERI